MDTKQASAENGLAECLKLAKGKIQILFKCLLNFSCAWALDFKTPQPLGSANSLAP